MHCYINRDRTVQGVLDPEEYAGALRQLVLGNKEPFLDLITNAADCLLEVLDIPFKFVTGQPKVAIYPDHVVVELKLSDDYKLPEIPDDNPAGMRQSVFKFSSMDNVIDCCCRLRPSVLGTSSLYKRDKDYYLVLTDFVLFMVPKYVCPFLVIYGRTLT